MMEQEGKSMEITDEVLARRDKDAFDAGYQAGREYAAAVTARDAAIAAKDAAIAALKSAVHADVQEFTRDSEQIRVLREALEGVLQSHCCDTGEPDYVCVWEGDDTICPICIPARAALASTAPTQKEGN